MDAIAFMRRTLLGLAGTALGIALLTIAANASELASAGPASGGFSGLRIHGADETLRNYCEIRDGVLWFVTPGGARYELVTSTNDPVISNPGDGAFHPFEVSEVRAALASLSCSLGDLSADVFLLPYPRRYGLDSAAGPGLILLSPGVRALTPGQQHSEFIHELGHVVQYARMPDSDQDAWSRYRSLRGISDVSTYHAAAMHADRPHEIFAEDFRALFGAQSAGSIENPSLTPPSAVPGLSDFMLSLAGRPVAGFSLAAWPNPSNAAMSFSRSGRTALPLEVFDPAGRRLATLQPIASGAVTQWRWNGTDRTGAPVEPGMYFARTRDGQPALRVIRIR